MLEKRMGKLEVDNKKRKEKTHSLSVELQISRSTISGLKNEMKNSERVFKAQEEKFKMQEDKYKTILSAKAQKSSLELKYLKEDHDRVTALLEDTQKRLSRMTKNDDDLWAANAKHSIR